MHFSTRILRYTLHAPAVTLASLIILLPVKGTTAPQEGNPREYPPKLLDYSKMTTKQLVDEGEKIIFCGIGQSKVQGAIGKAQCPLCHAMRKG